jgi:DNA polymerase-3 subunit delta'
MVTPLQNRSLLGHLRQRDWFRNAIASGRLASTFLFVGPEGIGKRTFAIFLAKSLFCERNASVDLDPCGACPSCLQVDAGTHPDILQIAKPEDRAFIPMELLVGRREARMQEGLCHDIRLRPMSGDRRIAIIDDCDALNPEGANSLLKTLEEPPPRALIILIGTSLQRQLPTIRSRCQVIRFDVPTGDDAIEILRRLAGHDADDTDPDHFATAIGDAGGDLTKAALFLDEDIRQFNQSLDRLLSEEPPEALALAKTVTTFVEGAGKEAPARRNRMRQVCTLTAEHYRQRIRQQAFDGGIHDASDQVDRALYRLQRTLDARYQIDRNANQATLIESWAVDLQRGTDLEDLPG